MKSLLPGIPVLMSIVVLFSACSTVNSVAFTEKPAASEKADCFVQMKDGSIRNFSSLRLETGLFTTPHLVGDGKTKIEAKDVWAYQTPALYAICPQCLQSDRSSKVAKETLPGFAVRIASGKMNIYSRMYYNGAEAVEEFFVQLGNDGKIVPYKEEYITKLLKGNAHMLDVMSSKEKRLNKKLQAVAEIYNQSEIVVN